MASYSPVKLAFDAVEPDNCDKEKAPVIFLHGLSASKEHWKTIPKIIADVTKRMTYALDARNHGDSEWCDIFDFECNSYDLFNFMDSINAPKAILVGHSMGGITGIKAALQKPERIEKLIVEDMNVRELPQPMLDMIKLGMNSILEALEEIPPEVDETTAKNMIGDFVYKRLPEEMKVHIPPPKEYPFALKRTADGRYDMKANVRAIAKALEKSPKLIGEATGIFEGPAYFLYGKLSPIPIKTDEAYIKQLFPNAELMCFETATHNIHDDCPEEFKEAVAKCISN